MQTIPERAKTVVRLNIYFESILNTDEIIQVILELNERLRDFSTVLKDLFEEEYLGESISIVRASNYEELCGDCLVDVGRGDVK